LIEIFGEEASEGIKIIDINTDTELLDYIFSKSKSKADCKIQMNKTGTIYCPSIKSKNCALPQF